MEKKLTLATRERLVSLGIMDPPLCKSPLNPLIRYYCDSSKGFQGCPQFGLHDVERHFVLFKLCLDWELFTMHCPCAKNCALLFVRGI